MNEDALLLLGFTGQVLFASRMVLQWLASERAGASVVPDWFWHLSLSASICVVAYAALAGNLVFLLTALPAAFVYVRMLMLHRPGGNALLLTLALPMAALVIWAALRKPLSGPGLISALGFAGWLLWMGRFPIQWWISEKRGTPTLGALFWSVSLVASVLLLVYAVWQRDWVMVAAFGVGPVVYARNLVLIHRSGGAMRDELSRGVDIVST